MNYSLTKSTMERYDIRITNENGWRCAWAIISISNDGVFNVQSDCGNFSYSWGSFGNCFKSFLVDICSKDSSYLYGKIHSRERDGKIDVEKTINNMKKRVIESRKEAGLRFLGKNDLTESEARDLWDALDCVQNSHDEITADAFSSIFYYELPSKERGKVFSDEWWYDDILVTTPDREAKTFCEVVAPVFAEILKEELKVKEAV
ncbi:hypothetical protein [Robertmurraya siralis]|uniref:hypothetical protein n=1 Tax=Robertmurraya siralis TaxID=77777 RepID=UPI0010F78ADC|nr:hypothetical protein [Robertmurraya siralis]